MVKADLKLKQILKRGGAEMPPSILLVAQVIQYLELLERYLHLSDLVPILSSIAKVSKGRTFKTCFQINLARCREIMYGV